MDLQKIAFMEEAAELLGEMEISLIELEKNRMIQKISEGYSVPCIP